MTARTGQSKLPATNRLRQLLIFVILFTLPLERLPSLHLAGATHATVRLSQVAGLLLILLSAGWLWHRRRTLIRGPWIWLAAYLVVSLVSAAVSQDVGRSLEVTAFTAFAMVLARTLAVTLDPSFTRRYLVALLAGAAASLVVGLYQFVGDLAGLAPKLTGLRPRYAKAVFGFPRIQSTELEPLYFADYLLIPIALLGSWLVIRRRLRPLLWVLLFLLVTAGWLTVSRGGAGAIIVVVAGLCALAVQRGQMRTAIQLAGVLVGSLALTVLMIVGGARLNPHNLSASQSLSNFTRQSTTVTTGESSIDRSITRHLAVTAFKQHPIVGIGPGTFGAYVHRRQPRTFTTTQAIVNNEPLEILAETGIVGAIAIAGFIGAVLYEAWKRRTALAANPVALGFLLALAGIAIQYQTFSTLYITHVWVAIGFLLSPLGLADEVNRRAPAGSTP